MSDPPVFSVNNQVNWQNTSNRTKNSTTTFGKLPSLCIFLLKICVFYNFISLDPRVTDWPLLGSIWPTFFIVFTYVYFVFYFGPRYMKNRPAYELKTFIRFYNIFQIVSNAYIVYEILAVYPDATALRCDTGDYSWNPDAVRAARACYYVTLLKIVDLIETGLFVLRKKENQISFLHVYHHISTVVLCLILTRYFAGGMAVFYPALNSTVHIIMYSYYFLSSIEGIKKEVQRFKRYITIIQMVQFVFLLLHAFVALNPFCIVPKFPILVMVPNVLVNFYLFYDFYKKTYLGSKKIK